VVDNLEPFCQAHPFFFAPVSAARDDSPAFEVSTSEPWTATRDFEWTYIVNSRVQLAAQGWKVHVSTTLDAAEEVLWVCSQICFDLGVPFKHLSSHGRLFWRNSKGYPREHAGKFVTCYPSETLLKSLLDCLERGLHKFHGPYVLSDRRWRKGPVFLRYGAFRPRLVDGEREPTTAMLETPEGKFVLDDREPAFHIPDWVPIPDFMRDWSTTDPSAVGTLPFMVTDAIQFSNAGGTYRGYVTDENDTPAIIKEARPFAGLDFARRSATERLAQEEQVLQELSGISNVARILWSGQMWEHRYLAVTEHPAIPLSRWVTRHYPLYDRSHGNVMSYFSKVHRIIKNLRSAVNLIHERGWAHLDLHLSNVLVADDDNLDVFLIDFEAAQRITDERILQTLAAPGFRTKYSSTPDAIDWHGVYKLSSYLLVPIIIQSELVPDYPAQVRALVEKMISGMPDRRVFRKLSTLLKTIDELEQLGSCDPIEAATQRLTTPQQFALERYQPAISGAESFVDKIVSGLVTLKQSWPYEFREYPVHPYGFEDYSTGLAYGDAGVLASIALTNQPENGEANAKRIESLLDEASTVPARGLFAGALGSLFALAASSEHSLIVDVINSRAVEFLQDSGTRVFDEGPGVLLGLLRLLGSAGDPDKSPAFSTIMDRLRETLDRYSFDPTVFAPLGSEREIAGNQHREQNSGLFYGHLGIAWLFKEAYSFTGDETWLEPVDFALHCELTGYEFDSKHGTLQLVQGYRELPYLSTGSAGFGVVLSTLQPCQVSTEIHDKAEALRVATEATFSIYPGLFNGYAGLALGNLGLRKFLGLPAHTAEELVSVLAGYAISTRGGIVFAGDSGLRLTCDMATGSAGVLVALSNLGAGICDPLPAFVPATQDADGVRLKLPDT